MNPIDLRQWQHLNDRYVTALVAWVRALLIERIPKSGASGLPKPNRKLTWSWESVPKQAEESVPMWLVAPTAISSREAEAQLREIEAQLSDLGVSSALQQLSAQFWLSDFEQDIVKLCLAYELDTRVGWLCGLIQETPQRPFPTFGLAMTLFANAQWSSIPTDRTLRRYRLLDLRLPAGVPVQGGELRLAEPVVHYLRGITLTRPQFETIASPVDAVVGDLTESQRHALEKIYQAWPASSNGPAVFQLLGSEASQKLRMAAAVSQRAGWRLFRAP